MTPAAQQVYDRILAVAAEYPDLATEAGHEDGDRFFWAARMIPVAEGAPRAYLAIRLFLLDSGRIVAEGLSNGSKGLDFDWQSLQAVAQPYADDSADRAAAILRRAFDSIRRAEMPDRLIYRSFDSFEDLVAEKGADGLYRERAMTDADRVPA